MQYYRRSNLVYNNNGLIIRVMHRELGNIPGVVPAQDIYRFAPDHTRDPDRLYMTIKNPSKPYRPAYLA